MWDISRLILVCPRFLFGFSLCFGESVGFFGNPWTYMALRGLSVHEATTHVICYTCDLLYMAGPSWPVNSWSPFHGIPRCLSLSNASVVSVSVFFFAFVWGKMQSKTDLKTA